MQNRLKLINNSLKVGETGGFIFDAITDFSPSEWAEAYSNIQEYRELMPYLVYAYDASKVEQIAKLIGHDNLARLMIDLWFEIFHGNTQEESAQPSIFELGNKPCLLPLFELHMLTMMTASGYDSETNTVIRKKFKSIVSSFTDLLSNPKVAKEVLAGTLGNTDKYPKIFDYDDKRLNDAINKANLMASISLATSILSVNVSSETKTKMLEQGDLEGLISISNFSSLDKQHNCSIIKSVESYIVEHFPSETDWMSEMTLDANESHYIRSLYIRGLLIYTSTHDEIVHSKAGRLNIPTLSECSDDESSGSLFKGLFSRIKSLLSEEKEGDSKIVWSSSPHESGSGYDSIRSHRLDQDGYDPLLETHDQFEDRMSKVDKEESLEDLLILNQQSKRKKNKGYFTLLLAGLGIAIVAGLFFSHHVEDESDGTTVISQNTQEESKFKVVIVK